MTLGKGIAVAGIWIGVAIACFAPVMTGSVVYFMFTTAAFATWSIQ